ncbi:hypothetical protein DPMN_054125 [Dreissena polymorpha]|uniref:Uncharacterized protein n=1 Tax=Dreissena polymorpha TaxID=45954 RepID=A0A9D4CND2_DREPO|nr:hypothetical protein DPMN_054125 [Dreissena polymorpha]
MHIWVGELVSNLPHKTGRERNPYSSAKTTMPPKGIICVGMKHICRIVVVFFFAQLFIWEHKNTSTQQPSESQDTLIQYQGVKFL